VARTVAAFDFDGTLTSRDSMIEFLAAVAGWPAVAKAATLAAPVLPDRNRFKEQVLTHVFKGRPLADVDAQGRTYGERVARSRIVDAMRERVAWHRSQGHEVVIVSASLQSYLAPVAESLALDALLCTELEADAQGLCTGQMVGGNCRGQEKASRLAKWINDPDAIVWAYGDSSGDTEMLAMATHPVKVKRGKLRTA
jgi:phosphatidylglycerophosphatase C